MYLRKKIVLVLVLVISLIILTWKDEIEIVNSHINITWYSAPEIVHKEFFLNTDIANEDFIFVNIRLYTFNFLNVYAESPK